MINLDIMGDHHPTPFMIMSHPSDRYRVMGFLVNDRLADYNLHEGTRTVGIHITRGMEGRRNMTRKRNRFTIEPDSIIQLETPTSLPMNHNEHLWRIITNDPVLSTFLNHPLINIIPPDPHASSGLIIRSSSPLPISDPIQLLNGITHTPDREWTTPGTLALDLIDGPALIIRPLTSTGPQTTGDPSNPIKIPVTGVPSPSIPPILDSSTDVIPSIPESPTGTHPFNDTPEPSDPLEPEATLDHVHDGISFYPGTPFGMIHHDPVRTVHFPDEPSMIEWLRQQVINLMMRSLPSWESIRSILQPLADSMDTALGIVYRIEKAPSSMIMLSAYYRDYSTGMEWQGPKWGIIQPDPSRSSIPWREPYYRRCLWDGSWDPAHPVQFHENDTRIIAMRIHEDVLHELRLRLDSTTKLLHLTHDAMGFDAYPHGGTRRAIMEGMTHAVPFIDWNYDGLLDGLSVTGASREDTVDPILNGTRITPVDEVPGNDATPAQLTLLDILTGANSNSTGMGRTSSSGDSTTGRWDDALTERANSIEAPVMDETVYLDGNGMPYRKPIPVVMGDQLLEVPWRPSSRVWFNRVGNPNDQHELAVRYEDYAARKREWVEGMIGLFPGAVDPQGSPDLSILDKLYSYYVAPVPDPGVMYDHAPIDDSRVMDGLPQSMLPEVGGESVYELDSAGSGSMSMGVDESPVMASPGEVSPVAMDGIPAVGPGDSDPGNRLRMMERARRIVEDRVAADARSEYLDDWDWPMGSQDNQAGPVEAHDDGQASGIPDDLFGDDDDWQLI